MDRTITSFADLARSIHANGFDSRVCGIVEILSAPDAGVEEIVKEVAAGFRIEMATFLTAVVTVGLVTPAVVANTVVRLTSLPKIFQKVLAGAGVVADGTRNAVFAANPTISDMKANL